MSRVWKVSQLGGSTRLIRTTDPHKKEDDPQPDIQKGVRLATRW